jgi:hypothetical protein
MRLIHFAFAITLVLLGITGYLAWEGQQEARGAKKELEFIRDQQASMGVGVPSAPVRSTATEPVAPPVPPVEEAPPEPEPVVAAEEMAGNSLVGVSPTKKDGSVAVPGGRKTPASISEMPLLTAQQRQVAKSAVVARVTDVKLKEGFVVVDAGSDKGLAPGQMFDVRRANGLVGRVKISGTVAEAEAIADVIPGATPPGVKIESGDELVKMPDQ